MAHMVAAIAYIVARMVATVTRMIANMARMVTAMARMLASTMQPCQRWSFYVRVRRISPNLDRTPIEPHPTRTEPALNPDRTRTEPPEPSGV